jgi:hypothetical protein
MYLKPTAHWSKTATMIALLPSSRRQRVTEKEHDSIVQTFVISLRINPLINLLKPATETETEAEAEQSSHVLPRRNPTQLEKKKARTPKSKIKSTTNPLSPSFLASQYPSLSWNVGTHLGRSLRCCSSKSRPRR